MCPPRSQHGLNQKEPPVNTWMLYGAAGHTGALIAAHARDRGHRPLLAGRGAQPVTELAGRLDLPHQVLGLDDPAVLDAALADVNLVLNAAGPFLRTAAPLAEACLRTGTHYLDIGNELQVFTALYDLHDRARQAGVAVIPGTGFGVVATNCLARYVSDQVGGAQHLDVAARGAAAAQGPGIAASIRENLPNGGWIRQAGRLRPQPLGSGITTITLPDGPCAVLPFPTGDLEAAFRATSAPDITAYSPVPAEPHAGPTGHSGGREPPAPAATRRPGCRPASPTPSPPPPASAPWRRHSPGPCAAHSARPRRSAPASSSRFPAPPGPAPYPQKRRPDGIAMLTRPEGRPRLADGIRPAICRTTSCLVPKARPRWRRSMSRPSTVWDLR
jgi:hypothetical protein